MKKILLILIFCFIIAISFSLILNNNKIDNLVLINESNEIFINNNVQKDKNLKSNKFITNILFSINRLNNNHTINYVLNGGINPNNAITTYKMYEEVTLPVPTKKNAIFMGWYIDSDYKNKITKIDKGNEENYNLYAKWEFNAKRNYEYSYYTNNNDYNIKNKDDIKKAIYNGLNEGNNTITLYCAYNDYHDCLNDFYLIYDNNYLMSSISNYVSPYNRYSSIRYRININNNQAKIYLDITKKYTEKEIKEIEKKIESSLKKINLNKMSDEKKIKWAHDFIINRNKYDEIAAKKGTGNAYSAYGAIVGNKATCQGYSEAMAILLDKFNIPNIMISSGIHIWNLVNINGKWLHLDATWDDPITSNGAQIRDYDFYLISSKKLSKLDNSNNHEFNSNYYLESLMN